METKPVGCRLSVTRSLHHYTGQEICLEFTETSIDNRKVSKYSERRIQFYIIRNNLSLSWGYEVYEYGRRPFIQSGWSWSNPVANIARAFVIHFLFEETRTLVPWDPPYNCYEKLYINCYWWIYVWLKKKYQLLGIFKKEIVPLWCRMAHGESSAENASVWWRHHGHWQGFTKLQLGQALDRW